MPSWTNEDSKSSGPPHADGPVTRRGQGQRRTNDPMQSGVQLQVGADLDRQLEQQTQLIAIGRQLVELVVYVTEVLRSPSPESRFRSVSVVHLTPRAPSFLNCDIRNFAAKGGRNRQSWSIVPNQERNADSQPRRHGHREALGADSVNGSPRHGERDAHVCCIPAFRHIARINNTDPVQTAIAPPAVSTSSLRGPLLDILDDVGQG